MSQYVSASSSSRSSGTFKQVLSSPLYRGATIAMFLSGLGASAAAPQIVLFLVKELGTPLPIAGLYYLTNLTAPIAGYLVGNHSDRTGERLILFRLCALAGFAGWAAIALSTKVWMPFLISSLVLAFSVAASSQLFAAVRDDLDQEAQGSSESVVAIVQMALTAGDHLTHYTRVEPSRFPPRLGWPIVRSPMTLTRAVLPALSARSRAERNSSGRSTYSP